MDPIVKRISSLLVFPALALTLQACSHSEAQDHSEDHLLTQSNDDLDVVAKNSYAEVDLSKADPSIVPAIGTSSVLSTSVLDTSGASFLSDLGTWSLDKTTGEGLEIGFDLSQPTMVQLGLWNAFSVQTGFFESEVSIQVNGKELDTLRISNGNWHETVVDIPGSMLNSGGNTVKFALLEGSSDWHLQSVDLIPRNIYSVGNELTTTLYAQFGLAQDLQNFCNPKDQCETIWTRSYGVASSAEMIPGPTYFYNPGDLLTVNLINKMDGQSLNEFEAGEAANLPGANGPNSDEVLANLGDDIRQEVNIPHNLNNTNLHVHGLHVDPAKDDVTIVIVPEDEAGTVDEYDAPHHIPEYPEDLKALNEGSVSDQSVKPGRWSYQYRIPENHLPGTHWFHPHKHGSTAAQVENGMAGSMVIQEPSELAMFPGFEGTEWAQRFDQVMMIQQIANYGLQQGVGGGKTAVGNSTNPVTVINGTHQPNHDLAPGQVVRWRFVNAGANHRAFNHMWLGKDTGLKDEGNNPVFVSQPIWAVAFDGITLSKKAKATAESPFLLAPGNRADIVFQVPQESKKPDAKKANDKKETSYSLFKYYPTGISIVDPSYFEGGTEGKVLKDYLSRDCSNYDQKKKIDCTSGSKVKSLRPAFAPTSNPYLFLPNSDSIIRGNNTYDENFDGKTVQWTTNGGTAASTPIVPIIKVKDKNGGLEVTYAKDNELPKSGDCSGADGVCKKSYGKWQPQFDGFGGGAVNPETLLTISVNTQLKPMGPDAVPEDSYLSTISPSGSFSNGKTAPGFEAGVPAYVSPFKDEDILQSRPVTFDKSGAAIEVIGTGKITGSGGSIGKARVGQFILNGRPFALNDPIGNSTTAVDTNLSKGATYSELKQVESGTSDSTSAANPTQCTPAKGKACLDIQEEVQFYQSDSKPWQNGVCKATPPETCDPKGADGKTETTFYWANPGYYQNLVLEDGAYRYDDADIAPNWHNVSGLHKPAAVNPGNKYGKITGNVNGVPGLPVATTAEEWVLINNSDIGHPFHIHINPFFVTEVGQLSYKDEDWTMDTITIGDSTDSDINHFVGNWWDTVIVPPHGYVKVRYWMNVPNQTGIGADASVEDDFNKIGIWVYHCHILRHEDRGMMMPVVTQALQSSDKSASAK